MLRFCILICCALQVNAQFNIFAALFGGNTQIRQMTTNKQLPVMFALNTQNTNPGVQRRGSLAEIFEKLAALLRPLLPFVNVLLQQITEILKSLTTNLKSLLEKIVSLLNMILPDWQKIVRQLLIVLTELITKHVPELLPLLKEVNNIVVHLLQIPLGVNGLKLD